MRTTAQKLMWEVNYCIKRVEKRSLCLGDILLSCAIEEVRKRAAQDSHGASTYIWLVLAGFSNIPALHLYLAHGIEIIGFYEAQSQVLLAVRNVGDESTRRALKQVTGKLESTFLLPVLKVTVQPWMALDDMFSSSSSKNIPVFCRCWKSNGRSRVAGSSITDQLEIQRASSQELQEDQSPHLRVSEQPPAAHTGTVASLQGTSEIQRACSQEIQEEARDVSEDVPFSGQSPVATEGEED